MHHFFESVNDFPSLSSPVAVTFVVLFTLCSHKKEIIMQFIIIFIFLPPKAATNQIATHREMHTPYHHTPKGVSHWADARTHATSAASRRCCYYFYCNLFILLSFLWLQFLFDFIVILRMPFHKKYHLKCYIYVHKALIWLRI